jgi:hypothetical protein
MNGVGFFGHVSEEKEMEIPGLIKKYQVNLYPYTHVRAYNLGIGRAVRATTLTGFLVFGQYEKGLKGNLRVVYSLLVDNVDYDDAYIAILDVVEDGSKVIAKRVLTRKDFLEPNKVQRFELDITGEKFGSLEFRVYYLGNSYFEVRGIYVFDRSVIGEKYEYPSDEALLLDDKTNNGTTGTDDAFVYNLKRVGYDLYNGYKVVKLLGYSTYSWKDMKQYPWENEFYGMSPDQYGEEIKNYGGNFTRLFCIDTWTSSVFPWVRSADGKFDLNQLNPEYFENLRNLVKSFHSKGIVVMLDVFDNVALWDTPSGLTWRRHPFNAANGGPIQNPRDGRPEFYIPNSYIRSIQEIYIRHLVNSLREYKNVIFEVCNEYNMGGGPAWHNWVSDVIKSENNTVLVSASIETDRFGYFDVWSYKNVDIISDHSNGWVSRDFKNIWKNYTTLKLREPGKPVILSTDGSAENYAAQHKDMVEAARFAYEKANGLEFKDLYKPVAQDVKTFFKAEL